MTANIDFESYSAAGFIIAPDGSFSRLPNATRYGLSVVGAAVYAEHPSTEVLSLSYDLDDGRGCRVWIPGLPAPYDLFDHVESGGLIHAWNSGFEWLIWDRICHRRYGWPELPLDQMRCTMSRASAFSLPGALEKASVVLGKTGKNKEGDRLIKKFSVPRKPTKTNSARRILPSDDLEDSQKFIDYNIQDVKAEIEIGKSIPELSAFEREVWLTDQRINMRGCAIDLETVDAGIEIIRQLETRYNARLVEITGGKVSTAFETAKLAEWLGISSVDKPSVETELDTPNLAPDRREVLEIRQKLSKTSTKKLFAFRNTVCSDGRIRGLFVYSGAGRTRRWAGRLTQPHNSPKAASDVKKCLSFACGKYCGEHHEKCPRCKAPLDAAEWDAQAAEEAIRAINTRSLQSLEFIFGDVLDTISGCIRGLYVAAPGHRLICSDYSAIEAVVLAELAGEKWRQEVFRTHGRIYELSAEKITGVPMTEDRHPHRGLGKIAELASGYQGSVGAWKRFGADKFFPDDAAMLEAVKKWRRASPAIAGGYNHGGVWVDGFWKNIENAAKSAVQNPGEAYAVRSITFQTANSVLYCLLPSGGHLTYHQPQLKAGVDDYGRSTIELSYMSWNTNGMKGPVGWIRESTYGGKLVENITQATAREFLAHAMVELEKKGYLIVLHIHDEIVAEVPEGWGSIEELESTMADLPDWAQGYPRNHSAETLLDWNPRWPIKASGGWTGQRYRKG